MRVKLFDDIQFMESLAKAEIFKQDSKTALDPDEMRIGLQIAPKAVLKFLSTFLSPMEAGEAKDLPLKFLVGENNRLHVTKQDLDVYDGEVYKDGKVVTTFKSRSIPGVALIIMTTFEMYDQEELSLAQITPADDEAFREKSAKLDALLDQKIQMLALIEGVILKKISQKNAIEQLFFSQLNSPLLPAPQVVESSKASEDLNKREPVKTSKLKEFLDKKKAKKTKDYQIKMFKAEATCPYCNKELFNSTGFSGCICLGEDAENTVNIAKTEKGIKLSFHSSWDKENVLMVLQALTKDKV